MSGQHRGRNAARQTLFGWLQCDVAVRLRIRQHRLNPLPALAAQFDEYLIESLPLNELHGVEVSALVLADAEHRHDIRMMQTGSSLRFATKSLEMTNALQGNRRQYFECHVSPQRFLHG